jgi:predicted RNA binding protein YcfA (HicA-like mRNA interferase family)
MVRFLEGQGWRLLRVAGSHYVMEGGEKRTVVPVHGNQTMKIGTLRSILRDADMAPEEFERHWHGR